MNTQAIMIDKNAFEEKELWASFLNFSNNKININANTRREMFC
jgi:hypothetical protein